MCAKRQWTLPLLAILMLLIAVGASGFALTHYGPASFDAPLLVWLRALLLAGLLLSGIALSTTLKQWVRRPRPQLAPYLDHVGSQWSFASSSIIPHASPSPGTLSP